MSLKNQEVTYTPSGTSAERKAEQRAKRSKPAPTGGRGQQRETGLHRPADRERHFGDWGSREAHSLWGPHRLKPAPHRASTLTFAAAYPFITESGLGHEGTYIGTDVFGSGAFSYDPLPASRDSAAGSSR